MLDYDDSLIQDVLETSPHIVLVGASANPERDSFKVMAYLLEQDYQVHPVNPGLAGQTILGQTVYASLAEVPGPVEMVDIFRNAEAAGGVVDEALVQRERLGLRAIWMQEGVINEAAAAREQVIERARQATRAREKAIYEQQARKSAEFRSMGLLGRLAASPVSERAAAQARAQWGITE